MPIHLPGSAFRSHTVLRIGRTEDQDERDTVGKGKHQAERIQLWLNSRVSIHLLLYVIMCACASKRISRSD